MWPQPRGHIMGSEVERTQERIGRYFTFAEEKSGAELHAVHADNFCTLDGNQEMGHVVKAGPGDLIGG